MVQGRYSHCWDFPIMRHLFNFLLHMIKPIFHICSHLGINQDIKIPSICKVRSMNNIDQFSCSYYIPQQFLNSLYKCFRYLEDKHENLGIKSSKIHHRNRNYWGRICILLWMYMFHSYFRKDCKSYLNHNTHQGRSSNKNFQRNIGKLCMFCNDLPNSHKFYKDSYSLSITLMQGWICLYRLGIVKGIKKLVY